MISCSSRAGAGTHPGIGMVLPVAVGAFGAMAFMHGTLPPAGCTRGPRPRASIAASVAGGSNFFSDARAQRAGVTGVPLKISTFNGIRGVEALEPLESGTCVLAVPAPNALQVTPDSPCPRWADPVVWRSAAWDLRLALLLLRVKQQAARAEGLNEARAAWLDLLPQSFDTPIHWTDAQLAETRYPALQSAVAMQRKLWSSHHASVAAAATAMAGKADESASPLLPPTPEEMRWALSCVRSRAFSGPVTGTLKGAAAQLGFAGLLGVASILSGVLQPQQAVDGVSVVAVSVVFSDVVASRFARGKRHVLCPYLDMLNHASSAGGSRLSYEYFADSFSASLDPSAPPPRKGEQVLISYGERSNDQLLQYYGFVERGNPHDVFALQQGAFLLALAEGTPFPPKRLQRLKDEGVADPTAAVTLGRSGGGERALRLARLLCLGEDEIVEGGARAPADAQGEASEARVRAAVARAAELLLRPLQEPDASEGKVDGGRGFGGGAGVVATAGPTAMARAFREEKAAVLRDCIASAG